MNNIPRHLAEPALDTPILQWWANDYDFVYVILNPFFKVPGHSPATTKYGVQHVGAWAIPDVVQYVQANSPRGPNDAPDDFDSTIKRLGQKVSWTEIQQAIGAADFMEFARTVWLWVLQSERADKNPAIAKALTCYCDAHHVYPPEEDMLPAVLEPTLSDYLKRLTIDEVTI